LIRLTKTRFKLFFRQKKYIVYRRKSFKDLLNNKTIRNSITMDLHTLESYIVEELNFEKFRELYWQACKYITKTELAEFLEIPISRVNIENLFKLSKKNNLVLQLFYYVRDQNFLVLGVGRRQSLNTYYIDDSLRYIRNYNFVKAFNLLLDFEDGQIILNKVLELYVESYKLFKNRDISYIEYKKDMFLKHKKIVEEIKRFILEYIDLIKSNKNIELDYKTLALVSNNISKSIVLRSLKTSKKNDNLKIDYLINQVYNLNQLTQEQLDKLNKLECTDCFKRLAWLNDVIERRYFEDSPRLTIDRKVLGKFSKIKDLENILNLLDTTERL